MDRAEKLVIALLVLGVWAGAQIALLESGMPQRLPETIVARMLGMLDAAALLILHHYYSSTARSAEKDRTIRSLADASKPAEQPPEK